MVMSFEVRRPPRGLAPGRALALLGLILLVGGVLAPATMADDPPVHAILRDFLPNGKYVLRTEAGGTSSPAILFSKRAAAYLVRGSPLGAPVLVRTAAGTVETFPETDLLCRDDGSCDVKASVKPKELGRVRLEGPDIVLQVPGLSGRLVPTPPLLGWQRASQIVAHSPEYARDAKAYRIDTKCLDEIRARKGEVRVFVYFGSWCPTCILLLGRVIRLDQELSKNPASRVQVDYYGLPGAPKTWVEPEAAARNIDRLPSALVYVDGKFVRRISGYDLAKPETALAAALTNP
jgi:thiol-disulfide isomerase/thioredoxin